MKFLGYPRPDGSYGARNYVLVLPGGFIASKICDFVVGTKTIVTAEYGLGRTVRDRATLARLLIGLGKNPNVAGVLVHAGYPSAGFPEFSPQRLVEEISATGKPVELVDPVTDGGTMGAISKGIEIARRMVFEASKIRREPAGLEHLVLAVKCGHSDTTSGIAGNPAVGAMFDLLIDAGGTALWGETTEVIGAEHIVAKRGATPEVAQAILEMVALQEARALSTGEDIRGINPVPSNIAGGLSTIEEKSLGAIQKSGHRPIQSAIQYAERPPTRGLHFVNNWPISFSIFAGYAAAGAQLVIYQLGGAGLPGRTVFESPPAVVSPLVWTTANPNTYARGADNIDFFSGTILTGEEAVEQAGERLLKLMVDAASGTMTRSETLNYTDPVELYNLDPCF